MNGSSGPQSLVELIRRLQCVQVDSVSTIERNHHLVLAARMKGYESAWLESAFAEGKVFEYVANAACIIPLEAYPYFESIRRAYRERYVDQLFEHRDTVRAILDRIANEGPVTSASFKTTERVRGFWDNNDPRTKLTSHLLNLLNDIGEIRIVQRHGNIRTFDLAANSVPADLLSEAGSLSAMACAQYLMDSYMKAYRLFDLSDPRFGWEPHATRNKKTMVRDGLEKGKLARVEVEGAAKAYYMLVEDLESLSQYDQASSSSGHQSLRFLPPLDNLLWRRPRLVDVFDFEYKWEIYTPAAKRQFGCYAMPILYKDMLIGQMDARVDRTNKALIIRNLYFGSNTKPSSGLSKALSRAVTDFAAQHQAQTICDEASKKCGVVQLNI